MTDQPDERDVQRIAERWCRRIREDETFDWNALTDSEKVRVFQLLARQLMNDPDNPAFRHIGQVLHAAERRAAPDEALRDLGFHGGIGRAHWVSWRDRELIGVAMTHPELIKLRTAYARATIILGGYSEYMRERWDEDLNHPRLPTDRLDRLYFQMLRHNVSMPTRAASISKIIGPFVSIKIVCLSPPT